MSEIPFKLKNWLKSSQLDNYLTQQALESGKTLQAMLKKYFNLFKEVQLEDINGTVGQIKNWNIIIQELNKINISIQVQRKNAILKGDINEIYQIMKQLQQMYQENSPFREGSGNSSRVLKNEEKSEIDDAGSLLQILILIIMKNYLLSSKQSAALLADDSKYLAHIIAKGFKGSFKQVQNFIQQLTQNMTKILQFCHNDENKTYFLRAVKPTIISKSQTVTELGINLIQNFLSEIENRQKIYMDQIQTTVGLGILRHPSLLPLFAKFMMNICGFHQNLLQSLKDDIDEKYLNLLFLEVVGFGKRQSRMDQVKNIRGINDIIDKSIDNIINSETVFSALKLLKQLIDYDPNILSNAQSSILVTNLQKINIATPSVFVNFIQEIFQLLEMFGRQKNPLGPSLFKILVNKFSKETNRQNLNIFLNKFELVLEKFKYMPLVPIIESINSKVEKNTLTLTHKEFKFLFFLISHEKLELNSGVTLSNILSKEFIIEPVVNEKCGEGILSLIKKFQNQAIYRQMTIKLIKVCLAVHYGNAKKLCKSQSLSNIADVQDKQYSQKNSQLENFIYKIIEQGIQKINNSVDAVISYSLMQVEELKNQFGKGLRKILSLLGNPNQIIKKYQNQAKRLQQQTQKKQQRENRLKKSKINLSQKNLTKPNTLQKIESKKNIMTQSAIGVTPAAQRGLEKYQKVYLDKIQKVQKEQEKKKSQEERQKYLQKIFQRKMLENGISVKDIKDEEFQYLYDFGVKERQISKDQTKGEINLLYFDPEEQEKRERKGVEYSIRKYQKVLKLYFHQYSGFHKPLNLDSFRKISQNSNYLYTKSLWKIIKNHELDEFISVKEVQYLVKKINAKLDKQFDDPGCLDYEGFQIFIVQASYVMFTRPPKNLSGHPVSEMIDQFISRLKLYSSDNRINSRIFQDPQIIYNQQSEAIFELNRKLEVNPDYILPEGYKKIIEKKVIFTHRIFLDAMDTSYKHVYEILNQILYDSFHVNLIEPFTTNETVAKARPNLYQKFQGNQYQIARMSIFLKKQVAKIPIKDREIAVYAGQALEQICEAVELGHDKIGVKHQNKIQKDHKLQQYEENKRKQLEYRRLEERNKKLKEALQKHQQIEKQKEEKEKVRQAEQRIKQEQKRRKQKIEEQRLKNKVQQYQQLKRKEKQRRKMDQIYRLKHIKEEQAKKRKQFEQTKRKLQEIRHKRKDEQIDRKRIEDQENKLRKTQERRIFEEDQRRKKQLISQYKLSKSSLKVLDPL